MFICRLLIIGDSNVVLIRFVNEYKMWFSGECDLNFKMWFCVVWSVWTVIMTVGSEFDFKVLFW